MTKTMTTKAKASSLKKGRYPDGYCFKCNAKMKTVAQETVILKNHKRAVKGVCEKCEGQVYRLLAKGDRRTVEASNVITIPAPMKPQIERKVRTNQPYPNQQPMARVEQKQRKLPSKRMTPYPREERPKPNNFVDIVLLSVILTLAAALFVMINATIIVR